MTESRLQRIIGPLMIVIALLMGGEYWYLVDQQRNQAADDTARAQCQAEYNKAISGQLVIRSKLFAASDDARDELIKKVAHNILAPPPATAAEASNSEQEFRQYFKDYLKRSAQLEKERINTTLPPFPDCGTDSAPNK